MGHVRGFEAGCTATPGLNLLLCNNCGNYLTKGAGFPACIFVAHHVLELYKLIELEQADMDWSSFKYGDDYRELLYPVRSN